MSTGSETIRDLGDGLVLRRGTEADAEGVANLNADILRGPDRSQPNPRTHAWTMDLMSGTHPTCSADKFTVVEDTRTGEIVSSLNLIPQVWTYAGVRFGVGQIELVATRPAYRKRGLIRAQFEVVHAWSQSLGHAVQVIDGIPNFYRQFGYEMGLGLYHGHTGGKDAVPYPREGEEELFRVRPATTEDIPFLDDLYGRKAGRYLVHVVRDRAMWHYDLTGRRAESGSAMAVRMVEDRQGQAAGFLVHLPRLGEMRGRALFVIQYELRPGLSYAAVTPSVLRYLRAEGLSYLPSADDNGIFNLTLWLGEKHPAYDVLPGGLRLSAPEYPWYVRVADLPAFLRLIAPVLERRLAASALAGHSGDLRISFYRSGLHLTFANGRLSAVEPWQPTPEEGGDAAFPGLTFLQLLLGYRRLEELRYAFADCIVYGSETEALVEAIFPREPSDTWMVN